MTDEIKRLRHSKSEQDRRQALIHLNEYLSQHPQEAEAWYGKAGCHDFLGEELAAEPCYEKCFQLGWRQLPLAEQKSFFVGYGSTLRNNRKYEDSLRILREGILHFPEYPALRVFLALTLRSLGLGAEAQENLSQAAPLIARWGLDGYDKVIEVYAKELGLPLRPK